MSIPSWIYGVIYVLYTMKGITANRDNIGHDGHLGGALIGLLMAVAFIPKAFENNYILISGLAIPILIFLYLIITRPYLLFTNGFSFNRKSNKDYVTIEHKYNDEKAKEQAKLDKLLDKISQKGMEGLSTKEKDWLAEYSKNKKRTA